MEKILFKDYPNIETPIDADNLNTMQDNINEVITTILKILGLDVDTYDTGKNYVVDDFVVYQKELWRCINETTGTWNEEDWVKDSIIIYDYILNINSKLILSKKLLWTNPYPTSLFAGQTITLLEPIENFKSYEIVFLQNTTTTRYRTTGELPIGETLICQNIAKNQYRLLTSISGTSLTFGDGQIIDTYGSAPETNNENIIPLYVYGIK